MFTPVLMNDMSTESQARALASGHSPEHEHAHMLTVFSVSAGMVGVCLTTIGLIQVMENLRKLNTLCDEVLVFDALLFLNSCIFSYLALHHRFRNHYRRLRLVVDTLLMLGIIMMAVICGMIAYSIV